MADKGVILIVSGPAGTGKGTVVKRVCELDKSFCLSVSLTTRAPRAYEEHGREYFFVTKDEFIRRRDNGLVLEYTEYCGNFYGTPADYVREKANSGCNIILEIETDGASQVKKLIPDAVTIFTVPEAKAEIRRRLEGRGTETAEVIEKRLAKAEREIEIASGYDYIVINKTGEIDAAAEDIIAIARAERRRVPRNTDLLRNYK